MSGCRGHGRGVVLKCTILGAGVFLIECFGLWVSGLVFSLNVPNEFGVGFWQLWCQTIVKERKQWQETLLTVLRALLMTLGRIMQRV